MQTTDPTSERSCGPCATCNFCLQPSKPKSLCFHVIARVHTINNTSSNTSPESIAFADGFTSNSFLYALGLNNHLYQRRWPIWYGESSAYLVMLCPNFQVWRVMAHCFFLYKSRGMAILKLPILLVSINRVSRGH